MADIKPSTAPYTCWNWPYRTRCRRINLPPTAFVEEVWMRISEVLRGKGADVITITPQATVRELVGILTERNLGALVVSTDGTTVEGIVSERDVVRHLNDGPQVLDRPVAEIMTTEVQICEPGEHVNTLMHVMTEHRVRHVPVLVEGRLAGIISIGDVVKSRIGELEFERDQLTNYVAGAQ
jgi:CBS domain-containing protein